MAKKKKIGKAFLHKTYGKPGSRTIRQLNRYDRMPAHHREAYAALTHYTQPAMSSYSGKPKTFTSAATPAPKTSARAHRLTQQRIAIPHGRTGERRVPTTRNRSAAAKKGWATRKRGGKKSSRKKTS